METFTDDTVVALASFLSPHDMLSLALTCKRFGVKNLGTSRREVSPLETHNTCNNISLMEVAARTVLHTKWTELEINAIPRREDESWIGIYHEFLKLFHYPLQFDKLIGESCYYVDSADKTRVCSSRFPATAMCSNIMRSGKHSVYFQVCGSDGFRCGIMRPTRKDITSLECCSPVHDDLSRFSLKEYESLHNDNVDCCLLNTYLGNCLIRRRWKEWEDSELLAMDEEQREQALRQNVCFPFDWEGEEETRETSFKIGFVLDLDEGTLDVYKDDIRLGTLKTGLVGEYCWAVSLKSFGLRYSVSIGR